MVHSCPNTPRVSVRYLFYEACWALEVVGSGPVALGAIGAGSIGLISGAKLNYNISVAKMLNAGRSMGARVLSCGLLMRGTLIRLSSTRVLCSMRHSNGSCSRVAGSVGDYLTKGVSLNIGNLSFKDGLDHSFGGDAGRISVCRCTRGVVVHGVCTLGIGPFILSALHSCVPARM